ncbi:nuclear transport factor 2 family protein [Lusitaniella coriacea LEGE 07157]|uniref:Nuclear transport factor 2 family protein n=1 Tax=Lusitaniella coriacea LEGE 07157 TaxID=945747 RepID=A0A8J7DWQ3_9CYAN|nr:nuclear transport factor 2 family protein [Lusitaniella coriacea]MBE9115706.1 nuclear transport factor 2 family protein [Lusitaniella coriacea LEGE 07157]
MVLIMGSSATIPSLTIDGVGELTILRYFETLNWKSFEETVALFDRDGELHPLFESPIIGHRAIASYFHSDANRGMKLNPCRGLVQHLGDSHTQIEVTGRVYTVFFSVNVVWQFLLNPDRKILRAKYSNE